MFKVFLHELFPTLDVDGATPFVWSGSDCFSNVALQKQPILDDAIQGLFFLFAFIEPSFDEHNQEDGNHENLAKETYVFDIAVPPGAPHPSGDVLQSASFPPWPRCTSHPCFSIRLSSTHHGVRVVVRCFHLFRLAAPHSLCSQRGSTLRNQWMNMAVVAEGTPDSRVGDGARWNGTKASLMRSKNCTRKIRKSCTKVSEVDWNGTICSRTGEKHDGWRTYTPQRTDPNRPPAARPRAVKRSISVIGVYTDTYETTTSSSSPCQDPTHCLEQ